MKNYYYILGVEVNSTEKEIKSAYRKLSLKLHPDTNSGEKFFENRFMDIQEAYQTLSNGTARRQYNRHLRDLQRNDKALLEIKQELADQFEKIYNEREEELKKKYKSLVEKLKSTSDQMNEKGIRSQGILKKKKQPIVYAFLLFIASMFIFSTESRAKFYNGFKESDTNAVLTNLVYEWNKAHNETDGRAFFSLLDDNLMYYGKPITSKRCIEKKLLYFKEHPNVCREIIGQIKIDKISAETYKGSFLKSVETASETKFYPSYLVFKKGKKGWRITNESDLVSENNNLRQSRIYDAWMARCRKPE